MSQRYSVLGPNQEAQSPAKKRKPLIFIIVGLVLVACAIVIPIAVVVSSRGSSNTGASVASAQASRKGSNSHESKKGPNDLPAKPKWNFAKNKMVGLSLGSWLVLERWMLEDWFVEKAGDKSWDEWGFTLAQGSNATNVLEEHWNNWVTEKDIEKAHQAGINTLRVPTGFWMWIGTASPEPYVTGRQLAHFERLCEYAYNRDMYIIIDLHGLPGSQNGEQQSGHNTTTPTFYQPLQQARSDMTVKAVVDWIAQSPYHSIISAIEVINEPRPYTTEQRAMLRAYFERSYQTIQSLGPKAPAMFFCDGFVPGDKYAYWWDFAASHQTDPPSLIFIDHPYPGFFPAQTNKDDIIKQTCDDAAHYIQFPVLTAITEWSLRTAIQNTTWDKYFYSAQLNAWSWFAGSVFWSLRALDSKNPVLADPVFQFQFSFESLLDRGSIATPSYKGQPVEEFLKSIPSPCGSSRPLQPNSPRQGTAAATAVAAAAEASALIDGINKSIQEAAKGLTSTNQS